MSDFINSFQNEFEQAIIFFKKELSVINTGRANPSAVQSIKVPVYNTEMSLQELASISIPEARVIMIEPWDKTNIKEIVSAIKKANLEYQITTEAGSIRLIIPQMTEENRKVYAKQVKRKLEQARIVIRGLRDKVKENIQAEEKEKSISEDEKFKLLKELDDLTQEYTKKAGHLAEQKNNEIFTL